MKSNKNYTIRLRNIVVYGFHGVHQEEKTLGQRFEIDLEYMLKDPPDPWIESESRLYRFKAYWIMWKLKLSGIQEQIKKFK